MAGRGACAEQQQVKGLRANHMHFTFSLAASGGLLCHAEAHVEPVQQQVFSHLDRQLLACMSPETLTVLPNGQRVLGRCKSIDHHC